MEGALFVSGADQIHWCIVLKLLLASIFGILIFYHHM